MVEVPEPVLETTGIAVGCSLETGGKHRLPARIVLEPGETMQGQLFDLDEQSWQRHPRT